MSTLSRPLSPVAALGAVAALLLAGCGDDEPQARGESLASGADEVEVAGRADAPPDEPPTVESASGAILRNPSGAEVGTVTFETMTDGTTEVRVDLDAGGEPDTFHGIHVHANADPSNGEGCVADAAAAPDTWFVSADGHFAEEGTAHGDHRGDLPSVLVAADGTGYVRSVTDRFTASEVEGKAVVLHAGRDNFGNVPVGEDVDQYSANSPDATDLTAGTGNAGDRIACGVIEHAEIVHEGGEHDEGDEADENAPAAPADEGDTR